MPLPRRIRPSRPRGMSLVELMAAVVIVTILAGSAYRGYQGYIEDAQKNRVAHDLETITNALATYDRDHPSATYSRPDLQDLKGRYLDEVPADPWGADFIVDPILRRVISTGPDMKLQISVPGYYGGPTKSLSDGDDAVRGYAEQGLISFVAGDTLWQMSPDGRIRETITAVAANASANPAPDRNRILVCEGTNMFLMTRLPDDSWQKKNLAIPNVSGGSEANWSPDGLKFAFVIAAGIGVGVGDPTTGVPAVLVTTSVSNASAPSIVRGNREVVFADGALNIYRASAAAQSTLTTLNVAVDGTPQTDGARPSVSNDGKLVAYVSSSGGGDVYLRSFNEAKRQLIAKGAFKEVAIGPSNTLIAMTDGNAVYVTSTKPSTLTTGPLMVADGLGAIRSLTWR